MFDKLKQISEFKKIQESFKQEKETVEKQGIKVTINGNLEVEEIILNSQLSIEDQQNILTSALNEARENIQKKLAKAMMNSGLTF